VALAAGLPAGQPANPSIDQAPPVATPSTESFLASVAAGNRFEIDSSKLALERAKSAAVNIFAHRLVDEHTSADARFKQAVSQTKLPPPPKSSTPGIRPSSKTSRPAAHAVPSRRREQAALSAPTAETRPGTRATFASARRFHRKCLPQS
jgi:putative membrane protein